MLILTILLIAYMSYLIIKKINFETAVFFIIGLLSVEIVLTTRALNEIIDFIIAISASIAILLKKDTNKNVGAIFFIVGSITSFMDLLTEPLITLGLPLIIYMLLMQKQRSSIKQDLMDFARICFLWGMGYALTWLMKWILVSLIYNRDIIHNALQQAKFRSTGMKQYGYLTVVEKNLRFLSPTVISINLALIIIYSIIKLIKNRNGKINIKQNLYTTIPFICLGILPFIWYLALRQHSYIHTFFTYKILIITIISIFIIVDKILEPENKGNENERRKDY